MQKLNYFPKYYCSGCMDAKNPSAFKSGGRLRLILYPQCVVELKLTLIRLNELGEDYILVGNCTKILFPDGKFNRIVVCTKYIKGIAQDGNTLHINCGESLINVCHFAKNNGLMGLENLCSIPATIGGAVAMNAGAYGSTISDNLLYVDIYDKGAITRIEQQNLEFGYRYSSIKQKNQIVLSAGFLMQKVNACVVDNVMKKVVTIRKNSQPQGASLGSVFKKVGDISAGYYIENAGLKGYSKGGAEISTKHANFIVNNGNATSKDFLYLANLAKEKVKEKYNIDLELEAIIL